MKHQTQSARSRLMPCLALLLLAIMCLIYSPAAYADPCTEAGQKEWFPAEDKYKYCNGTVWVDYAQIGVGGACTGSAEWEWDPTSKIYKICSGGTWKLFQGGDGDSNAANLINLSVNDKHSCSIRRDGTAWCWGNGTNGQLGEGQNLIRKTAVQVHRDTGRPGWNDWKSISTGRNHTCGIRRDGTAWCWGSASYGRLGDGQTSTDRTRPIQVHTDTGPGGWNDWIAIDAGGFHTCGLRSNGTAWCWGLASYGRLGDGQSSTDRTRPVQVHNSADSSGWTDWKSITVGERYSCGVRANGTAWCWGEAFNGKLGDNQASTDRVRPVQVLTDTGSPGWTDWVAVKASIGHTCGIRTDGKAWCWGNGANGELGNGVSGTTNIPVQVQTDTGPTGWSDWVEIDLGEENTCGVRADKSAWCWGEEFNGKLGNGQAAVDQLRPVAVHTNTGLPGWTDWVRISVGNFSACGGREDGTIWCWGSTSQGRLGNNQDTGDQTRPVQVKMYNESISAGAAETCAVRSDGKAWCWGDGNLVPKLVPNSTNDGVWNDWEKVASGYAWNCGIRSNGTLWCWDSTTPPAQVPTDSGSGTWTDWISVTIGLSHTCGVRSNGTAWCWGDPDGFDSGGISALGNGDDTTIHPYPVQVQDNDGSGTWGDWVQLGAYWNVTCGVRSNGTAWCWGSPPLGDGDEFSTGSVLPVQVQDESGPGAWNDWIELWPRYGSACGIRNGGTAWCFGFHFAGDGTEGPYYRPKQVLTDTGAAGWTDWVQLTGGNFHTCGVRENGTAWCWGGAGISTNYVLGDGSYSSTSLLPAQVQTQTGPDAWSDWTKISPGIGHTCGIRNGGEAWCWGQGSNGRVGDGAGGDFSRPVKVVSAVDEPISITSTGYGACSLRGNGSAWCWGRNTNGQLGNGTTTNSARPEQVQTSSGGIGWYDWTMLSHGSAHACGVRKDGTAWCWGAAANGRLGDAQTSTDRTRPVQVQTNTGPGGWTDWIYIGAGDTHTCGVRANGTAWCWGRAANGRLGDNQTSTDQSRPVQVHSDMSATGWSDWATIKAANNHTCGTRKDGTAWCWGLANAGQLGTGNTSDRARPTQVQTDTGPGSWNDWVSVIPSNYQTCGLRSNGTAWCWGWAAYGQLGNGQSSTDATRPVQVHTDTGPGGWSDWKSIETGGLQTCGVRSNGTAWCWGSANGGRLGDGQDASDRSRPVKVHDDSSSNGWNDWITVVSGADQSCGIRKSGAMYCWGAAADGQLGNATTSPNQSRPVQVKRELNALTRLSTGGDHTCGIRDDGTMWCWGQASHGRLGDNQNTTNRDRPVKVHSDTGTGGWNDWEQVSGGVYMTCGIRTNGTAWCWGYGGATGDGTATPRYRPVQVQTDTGPGGWNDWIRIAAGGAFGCGIRQNGTLWCWGFASNGQIGDGQTATNRLRPVQVHTNIGLPGWDDWITVSATWDHACGVRGNGTAWCWGLASNGQLGDGQNSTNRSRPVQVLNSAGGAGWTDWVRVEVDYQHSCGLRSNGTAWCWGQGGSGRLGDGGNALVNLPVQVQTDTGPGAWSDWVQIESGVYHSCGRRSNGKAYCWGNYFGGRLGDGQNSVSQPRPREVNTDTGLPGWTDWLTIAAGPGHTCGIRADGKAYCWGGSPQGQVGDGTLVDHTRPAQVNKTFSQITALSGGGNYTCGIRDNGTAWCWGLGTSGQLGDNQIAVNKNRPTRVLDDTGSGAWNDWIQLSSKGSSSDGHSCGVRADGSGWCWGRNGYGQLGYGATSTQQARPMRVQTSTGPGAWNDWVKIDTGLYFSCGLRSNGTVWCWGYGSSGNLGNDSTSNASRPVAVLDSAGGASWTDWADVVVGREQACGIRSNGTAWCWGRGHRGQMGNGTTTASNDTPKQVQTNTGPGGWNDWVSLASGGHQICGIRGNGEAWCWGHAQGGQLGNGVTFPDVSRPVIVQTDTGPGGWNDWMQLTAGQEFTCGLRTNGTAWCWGENIYGNIGNGVTGTGATRPTQVQDNVGPGAWNDWIKIAAGGLHTCGARSNGTVWCWGQGTSGQLGDGTIIAKPRPVQVLKDTMAFLAETISAGDAHACGIRANGTAWCWGAAASGRLGDNQISTDRARPVQVLNDSGGAGWSNWAAINAASSHSCGVLADGSGWCWGLAGNGRLGNGTVTGTYPVPTRVQTDTGPGGWNDWVMIKGGVSHSCGIRSNGTAWCWGWASNGRLGDGQTTTDRTLPVQVQTDTGPGAWSDWSIIDVGDAHACGIRAGGQLWCWGMGTDGRLGNFSSTDRSRPVRVHTDVSATGWSDWVSVAAGQRNTCGIRSNGSAWCWGFASYGGLGDGQMITSRTRPVAVHTDVGTPGWTDWSNLGVGFDHTCGVRTNGTAWCWGTSSNGQVGVNSIGGIFTRPNEVHQNGSGPPGYTDWLSISTGKYLSCGVRTNGTAWCWGMASSGQLANNNIAMMQTRPGEVHQSGSGPPGWTDWAQPALSSNWTDWIHTSSWGNWLLTGGRSDWMMLGGWRDWYNMVNLNNAGMAPSGDGNAPIGACLPGAAGAIDYDTSNNRYIYCDGTNWYSMGQ